MKLNGDILSSYTVLIKLDNFLFSERELWPDKRLYGGSGTHIVSLLVVG